MGYCGEPLSFKYDKKQQGDLVLLRLSKGLIGKVLDHEVVNSVLYAAIERTDGRRFAAIVPFELSRKDGGWELLYKTMDETQCPCEQRCPTKILNLLDVTENEYANKWRTSCRQNTTRLNRK